jgi:hypothetical protein
VKEDSSFSEEKEAKRLLDALRGVRRQWGARATMNKSLFGSFSSEKELLPSCRLGGAIVWFTKEKKSLLFLKKKKQKDFWTRFAVSDVHREREPP